MMPGHRSNIEHCCFGEQFRRACRTAETSDYQIHDFEE
jgi:hypothetical protein